MHLHWWNLPIHPGEEYNCIWDKTKEWVQQFYPSIFAWMLVLWNNINHIDPDTGDIFNLEAVSLGDNASHHSHLLCGLQSWPCSVILKTSRIVWSGDKWHSVADVLLDYAERILLYLQGRRHQEEIKLWGIDITQSNLSGSCRSRKTGHVESSTFSGPHLLARVSLSIRWSSKQGVSRVMCTCPIL